MSLIAFDLVPVLGRVEIKIVCFEACGNELYLGTADGQVLRYGVEERMDAVSGEARYTAGLRARVQLSQKHAVTCLGAASGVGRLLALVDGVVLLLDHHTLATVTAAARSRATATTFCLNHTPTSPDPFTLEVCVGRRKSLQLLLIAEDRVTVEREVACAEAAVKVCMDGVWCCVAAAGSYSLYNLHTGAPPTPLFPYDAATTPLITRIMKEEFLLSGPGCLGMFVTCDGVSVRPPISWTEDVLAVAYHHPYVLAVTPHLVRIYSLVDQQVKQTVRFSGGSLVGNFDGQVYLASPTSVHCLLPQPWHKQVQVLLAEQRLEEAVELCEQQRGHPQHERLVQCVLQRAGFLRFQHGHYDQAADCFMRGNLDIRELLHLFPGLLASGRGFVRAVPPLHQIADMAQECSGDASRLQRAQSFVLNFLLAGRGVPARQHAVEVDTAVVKLFGRAGDTDGLLEFLGSLGRGRLACDVPECATELAEAGMHMGLERLYRQCGRGEAAVEVVVGLIRGELHDPHFPGPAHLRDVLLNLGEQQLSLRYSAVLLECDPKLGASLFTTAAAETAVGQSNQISPTVNNTTPLTTTHNCFDPAQVFTLLKPFPEAKLIYLHYLVDDLGVEDEKYHTELALHYADTALRLVNHLEAGEQHKGTDAKPIKSGGDPDESGTEDDSSEDDSVATSGVSGGGEKETTASSDAKELEAVRYELQCLLEHSNHYCAATLLDRIRRCPRLHHEKAALLGRLGEHERALQLLVHEVGDFAAAERYCVNQSKRTPRSGHHRHHLYLMLLKAYLQPVNGGEGEVVAALDLLCRHGARLPLVSALPLLPPHWSVALTHAFLRQALAGLAHQRRVRRLQRGLAVCIRGQQESLLAALTTAAGPRLLTPASVCSVCGRRVADGEDGVVGHVLYPNGVVAHLSCVPDTRTCPLTGTCVANTYTHNN